MSAVAKFERFMGVVTRDSTIRRLLEDEETRECAADVLASYFIYYLYTGRIPFDRLRHDAERCRGGGRGTARGA